MAAERPERKGSGLEAHLRKLKTLRGPGTEQPPRLSELKAWQSKRLAKTYADLASQPRYTAATTFFLEDLYGPKDFSARDTELLRIVPVMERILPESAVQTAALAVELEALSEDLDHRLARALAPGPLDETSYGDAYRRSATRAERMRQIELIEGVGQRLDALVKKPLIAGTLKLMRKPAHLAGLGDLQDFLEQGFGAFKTMNGSDEFLAVLRRREVAIMDRLFSGASKPFSA